MLVLLFNFSLPFFLRLRSKMKTKKVQLFQFSKEFLKENNIKLLFSRLLFGKSNLHNI